ncbi:putative integral membrane protein [Babesia bovis T2Bo]|uniref:putative integral membrane protein n=1 Tax=Babesia bovis T2Bo TaxID=484906 RepID=UPI001C345FEC|nr:putative integral membrane protein [Babesia bovis T2Bo]KAG6440144.1 putative integral membrane protein [Babesia bovis T2Bo]
MLVTTIGYLLLAAFVPVDWTHTKLDSLSPVTGHYHGTTWAMAEKVTGDNDTEEVVVVEGTTSDEVEVKKEKNDKVVVNADGSKVDANTSKHVLNWMLGLPANGDSTLRKAVSTGAKGWGTG